MKLFSEKQNPWPIGLVIYFIVFASYIIGFVVFASRQKMDLVREDYYDQEIRFQKQIDRVKRTAPLLASAHVEYNLARGLVTVSLPAVNRDEISGDVTFYRPSDAQIDSKVPIALDSTAQQSINVDALQSGLWKVRVEWKAGDQEYFFEKPILIRESKS